MTGHKKENRNTQVIYLPPLFQAVDCQVNNETWKMKLVTYPVSVIDVGVSGTVNPLLGKKGLDLKICICCVCVCVCVCVCERERERQRERET